MLPLSEQPTLTCGIQWRTPVEGTSPVEVALTEGLTGAVLGVRIERLRPEGGRGSPECCRTVRSRLEREVA